MTSSRLVGALVVVLLAATAYMLWAAVDVLLSDPYEPLRPLWPF